MSVKDGKMSSPDLEVECGYGRSPEGKESSLAWLGHTDWEFMRSAHFEPNISLTSSPAPLFHFTPTSLTPRGNHTRSGGQGGWGAPVVS